MAKRIWRNFDFVLLAVLLALSGFGVTMVYSATINTPGLGQPFQRQLIYVGAGLAVMLVAAVLDYRLLELVQHPFSVLVPIVLIAADVALTLSWRAGQVQDAGQSTAGALLAHDLPALGLTAALVLVAYLVDHFGIRRIDTPLMRWAAVGALTCAMAVGAFLLFRMSPARFAAYRLYAIGAGLAAAYLLDCLVLRVTDILRNPVYVLMLGLLAMTLGIGKVAGGSQSWLGAGMVQPSELAKLLTVVVLAKFLADRQQQLEQVGTVLVSLAIVAVPIGLIYLQPDLGTALTLVPIWIVMVWVAGIRLRHVVILAGLGLTALPLAWFGLQDYMRNRLLLFLNPASDPDSYFNVHQALVSIGSGGWLGKGLTHGTQSQLHFLRVRHTDFIFAVTAEELGFLGALAMMALLALLLWRMLRVAGQSRDMLGRLLASGVAAVILFQTVVNIGMNLGLLPVTGVPLPFVSYGGSSLITLMVGIGFVESVAMRHKKLSFG